MTNGGVLGARGGLMAASAVVALVAAGCGGSSSGGERPALIGLPQSTGAASAGPATQIASAPCQHPTGDITTALAPHLAADVQVDKAALLQTHTTVHGAPVYFLAGIATRNGARVGVAVWASTTPTQTTSWVAVDASAQTVSDASSAAGTPEALGKNAADYSHVTACATLGF